MTISTLNVPLRLDERGAIRIGNSRITLDLVVREHQRGATPEEIVRGYDVLDLAEVYAAITYYLQNREEIDAYILQRENEAAELRREIEASQKPFPSKEELLRRLAERAKDHASPGE